MTSALHDVRLAARALIRSPAYTSLIVGTLAIGFGFNIAMFGVVRGVLLEPLPWTSPERLVLLWNHAEGRDEMGLSQPELVDYKESSSSIEQLGAYRSGGANLELDDRKLGLWVTRVSRDLFQTLGTQPYLGRLFVDEEYRAGDHRAALLSFELWRRAFARSPDAISRTIRVDGEAYRVVGVMPPAFAMPTDYRWVGQAELYLPLPLDKASPALRNDRDLWTVARLAPDRTLAQATAELQTIVRNLKLNHPDYYDSTQWGIRVVPVESEVLGLVRPALLSLLAAAGLLLLVVCANVTVLVLVRSEQKNKDIAIRSAMGATRAQLIRAMLTENLLLSLAAAVLGLLLAAWALDGLVTLRPGNVPRIESARIDATAAGLAALLAAIATAFFGGASAWRATRSFTSETLASRSASGAAGSRRHRWLVVSEIAAAMVLLTSALLLIQSLRELRRVDLGFEVDNVVTADLMLPEEKYRDDVQTQRYFEDALLRVEGIAGVENAGLTSSVPFWNPGALVHRGELGIDRLGETLDSPPIAVWEVITPGLLETTGVAVLAGRSFLSADRVDGRPVALVSESLAHRFWGKEHPTGERIRFAGQPIGDWLTIVGIVEDIRDLAVDQPPLPRVYVPLSQAALSFAETPRYMALMFRVNQRLDSVIDPVRRALSELEPDVPLANARTLEAHLADALTRHRLSTFLLTVFAIAAFFLAVLGLFGVLSFLVGQRTPEIALRMALGATPQRVTAEVVRQGMLLATLGVTVGGALAFAGTRALSTVLYGVEPRDPLTFAGVVVLIVGASGLASYLPALRAGRIAPVDALRGE